MGWHETHEYYDALRRAEADLNRSGDGLVTWHPEYERVFGTPSRLVLALRSHWNNLVRAQVESDGAQDWRRIMDVNRLAAAHPGLAAAVARAARAARAAQDDRVTRSDVELVGTA